MHHAFIHLFILAISIAPLQVHYYSEALPTTNSTDTVSEFHAEEHRQHVSKGHELYRNWTPLQRAISCQEEEEI